MVSKDNGGCQPGEHFPPIDMQKLDDLLCGRKSELTIKAFHEANEARRRSDSGGGTEATWNLVDWTNELCGEAGELANIAKKVRRARPGKDPTLEEALPNIAHEIADVVICASLVAGYLGLDLEKIVREKFNIVSDKMGSDIKL